MKILLTGSGAPGASGIFRCLSDYHVITCDARDGYGYKIPYPHQQPFIPTLRFICAKENITHILSIVTAELEVLSLHKEQFNKAGIKIIISDYDILRILNDKYELLQKAKSLNIPTPKFFKISSHHDFNEAYNSLPSVCVKPMKSNGGRGFFRINDKGSHIFEGKAANNTLSKPEFLRVYDGRPYLVMEYLPGREWSVDCIRLKDQFLAVPRVRDEIKDGISWESTVTLNHKLVSYCHSLSVGAYGPLGFQFKEDKDGKPHLIECNPRLHGSVITSHFAGVNFPECAVLEQLPQHHPHDDMGDFQEPIKWGTKMRRVVTEIEI